MKTTSIWHPGRLRKGVPIIGNPLSPERQLAARDHLRPLMDENQSIPKAEREQLESLYMVLPPKVTVDDTLKTVIIQQVCGPEIVIDKVDKVEVFAGGTVTISIANQVNKLEFSLSSIDRLEVV